MDTDNRTYQNTSILYFLFYFPIYYFFSFFVVDDVHCFNDGEALERWGWLGQPIAAPWRLPPRRVVFRVSRDLAGVSCISRSRRGSSGDMSCVSRSSSGPHGDVFVCEHNFWQLHWRTIILASLQPNFSSLVIILIYKLIISVAAASGLGPVASVLSPSWRRFRLGFIGCQQYGIFGFLYLVIFQLL